MSKLQQQAVRGVKWTAIQTVVSATTGPVLLWIKSVFLAPDDFALISIILIMIGLMKLLESFGISQAVIQRDEISRDESSTLFVFNILFSGLLGVLLFFSAPVIAHFYEMPELSAFLRVSAAIVILAGPSLLFRAFLEKQMQFRRLSVIDMTGNVLIFLSTTLYLFLDLGVLSIVLGHITAALYITTAIIISAFHYKAVNVRLYFKAQLLKSFLGFGAFVSAKQLLTYLGSRLDELLIGYFLSPEILGVYHFGKNMLEKIRVIMTRSFGKVLFPVFSRLKNNRPRLGRAYQQISRYLSFAAFPVFTGIAITAHLFVPVLFGEKWVDSVIVFQVFSASMIFMLLTANISSSLLYSLNKPHTVFYIDLAMNSAYFLGLFLAAPHGMLPILITYSAYVILKTLILQLYTNRNLKQSFISYLGQFKVPFLGTVVMGGIVLLLQYALSNTLADVYLFLISAVAGILIFTAFVYVTDRSSIHELKHAITKGQIPNPDKRND